MSAGIEAIRRYDSAVISRGRRDELVPCAVQPRDLAIVAAVARHKFLTTPQLLDIWWPDGAAQVGRRRLARLFEAGYLDRFRPLANRGSFPWTYQLGREGHALLQRAEIVPRGKRFEVREVYDYRYVLHDLHLNAWVLAWRDCLGDALEGWLGETQIDPPTGLSRDEPLKVPGYSDTTAHGLPDPRPKQLRPDDILEVRRDDGTVRDYFIEYDRTRRVDKNYEKFRRYDTFLCWWGWATEYCGNSEAPVVLFVCQDEDHLHLFLEAADKELTGHIVRGYARTDAASFFGRRRIAFVLEEDTHAGRCQAWRVPNFPPGHPGRESSDCVRAVLPGSSTDAAGVA